MAMGLHTEYWCTSSGAGVNSGITNADKASAAGVGPVQGVPGGLVRSAEPPLSLPFHLSGATSASNPCKPFDLLLIFLQVIQCYVPYLSGIQLFCTDSPLPK